MPHTKESLIAFSKRVEAAFLAKEIRAPVHMCGGNEDALISVFQEFRTGIDWCFSNWRSMYHALLAGIPEEEVFQMILEGRSMYLMSRDRRFMASSIVGGILPIACGIAMGIKRLGGLTERCWVFVGDMTARTGIFHEFREYCGRHNLPVRIVVEDNGLSTDTDTKATWGDDQHEAETWVPTIRYTYKRQYPHVGVGKHVSF